MLRNPYAAFFASIGFASMRISSDPLYAHVSGVDMSVPIYAIDADT